MILLDSHTTPAGDTMTPNFLRVGDRQQRGDAAFSELPQKQIVGLELMLNADRPKRMGMCSVPSAILSHCRVWRAWLAEVKARAKVGCGEPLDTSRGLCGGGTGMRLQQRAGQLFRLGWCLWSGTFYLESVSLHPSCPRSSQWPHPCHGLSGKVSGTGLKAQAGKEGNAALEPGPETVILEFRRESLSTNFSRWGWR